MFESEKSTASKTPLDLARARLITPINGRAHSGQYASPLFKMCENLAPNSPKMRQNKNFFELKICIKSGFCYEPKIANVSQQCGAATACNLHPLSL